MRVDYVREIPKLNAKEKRAAAALLIRAAASAAAMFEERREDNPESEVLAGVSYEQIAAQFATWLHKLPGDYWHRDLPEPDSFVWLTP